MKDKFLQTIPGNRTLYGVFWTLLALALTLSVSLLVLLIFVLNPMLVRLKDTDSLLLVLDPAAIETLSPYIEGKEIETGLE